jgi:hypothetical protein
MRALQLAVNVRPFFGHKVRQKQRFALNICGTRSPIHPVSMSSAHIH